MYDRHIDLVLLLPNDYYLYLSIKDGPYLVTDEYNNDGSAQIVYHSSDSKFTKFNTPAFFATNQGAYNGDYEYACAISIKNMLDLRALSYGRITRGYDQKWLDLVRDIFRDSDLAEKLDDIMEFAEKYGDSYGFFKLVSFGPFEKYRWDVVFEYMKKNGYDGAIFRESDQSISYYFDAYIVMQPSQIQVLVVDEKN